MYDWKGFVRRRVIMEGPGPGRSARVRLPLQGHLLRHHHHHRRPQHICLQVKQNIQSVLYSLLDFLMLIITAYRARILENPVRNSDKLFSKGLHHWYYGYRNLSFHIQGVPRKTPGSQNYTRSTQWSWGRLINWKYRIFNIFAIQRFFWKTLFILLLLIFWYQFSFWTGLSNLISIRLFKCTW